MPAFLDQGLLGVRNAFKGLVTHVGLSTDTTAFVKTQTALDPANVGAANNLIKAATKTDVDGQTADFTISVDGNTELTGKAIGTIAAMSGSTRTDALTRTPRTQTVGVQAGDLYTIGVRGKVEDNTP